MTAPASTPKPPRLCPSPPTPRVLDRMQKTPLGSQENRLGIGCFTVAFHDNVLLIENGSITHLSADLQPATLRIVLKESQLIIDMWPRSGSSVTLTATPDELEAARRYFVSRNIAVCAG